MTFNIVHSCYMRQTAYNKSLHNCAGQRLLNGAKQEERMCSGRILNVII